MSKIVSREIRLKNRPRGMPTSGDFELTEAAVSDPGEGQVMVQNSYMSVDPYMRGRMRDQASYLNPFQLGRPLLGACVGQVIKSRGKKLQVGDTVVSNLGWREYYVADETRLRLVEPTNAPVQAHLGVLGLTGFSAYVGLLDFGAPSAGETVFVSAAAGAVGSVVCQIAKIKGCKVVGSAGSADKVSWLLNSAGVDGAFNYKAIDNLHAELGRQCPDGIDVYFENVGGEHLAASLAHMNNFGRIPICGLISQYNATKRPIWPSNIGLVITKRLKLQGFLIIDHEHRRTQFLNDMNRWIVDGRLIWRETIVEGIENAPDAFIGLFEGKNIGKMLVKID